MNNQTKINFNAVTTIARGYGFDKDKIVDTGKRYHSRGYGENMNTSIAIGLTVEILGDVLRDVESMLGLLKVEKCELDIGGMLEKTNLNLSFNNSENGDITE